MKEFVLLAYDNTVKSKIANSNLEKYLEKHKMLFNKNTFENYNYENVIGYQVQKCDDKIEKSTSPSLIAGDVYGLFSDENQTLLNYQDALKIIEKSNIEKEYIALEGNACICSVFKNRIVFQTDLEGYRRIYYYSEEGVLCISTHLPLILKSIKKNWILRENAVTSFIFSRESKWPLTFIEDIYTLSPISRAVVANEKINITSKKFSDFYKLKNVTKDDLSEQLLNQYKLLIRRKTGKNTAVTLSGGYDSNCLTKLYSDTFKGDFSAVSVGYEANRERDNNIYDETIYAEKIAQAYKVPFKRYLFSKNEFFNNFDSFINSIDQPGLDPSSNFIMNKYLYEDGFDLVVNGMGGDACYKSITNNRDLYLGLKMFKMLGLFNIYSLNNIGKVIDYRGPLRFFKQNFKFRKPKSFYDLIERSQMFANPACHLVNEINLCEIDKERSMRIGYFEEIFSNAKTIQEISYSLALFSWPDEYHALSMAERNNMEILMPFVNIKTALMLMNGSHYHNVNNRSFEMSLFGGINTELLAKSKSGLSIPYTEWMPSIAEGIFEFYIDLGLFQDIIDIKHFKTLYNKDDVFASSVYANQIIYKLLVIKEYILKHDLSIS